MLSMVTGVDCIRAAGGLKEKRGFIASWSILRVSGSKLIGQLQGVRLSPSDDLGLTLLQVHHHVHIPASRMQMERGGQAFSWERCGWKWLPPPALLCIAQNFVIWSLLAAR